MVLAPSLISLTNYYLPLSEALASSVSCKVGNMETKLQNILSYLSEVDKNISRVSYKFQPEGEFKKVDNVQEMSLIYWSEIIQRYHICCASTILRLKKWYEAMLISYENNNYYGFCSSLRGLIESSADSFSTLGSVTYSVIENISHITLSISGNADKLIISTEVEDELIHYIYGRKLSKEEKNLFPKSHNSKHVRDYLDSLKSEALISLYSELCQVSHPSMMSNTPFMISPDEHSIILHSEKIDRQLNDNLLSRHIENIFDATNLAIIPAISGFKIINDLNSELLESLTTSGDVFDRLVTSEFWANLERKKG